MKHRYLHSYENSMAVRTKFIALRLTTKNQERHYASFTMFLSLEKTKTYDVITLV